MGRSTWSVYNTLQHAATQADFGEFLHMRMSTWSLMVAATHCNTLQHAATRYNTLQHTATQADFGEFCTWEWLHDRCNTLQHAATRCNTPYHAATHCNTLQHAATHCHTQSHAVTHNNTLPCTAVHCKFCTCAREQMQILKSTTSKQSARYWITMHRNSVAK